MVTIPGVMNIAVQLNTKGEYHSVSMHLNIVTCRSYIIYEFYHRFWVYGDKRLPQGW